jgi:hypothetical protein
MTVPEQDDLTADDEKVSQTDNGWHDGDGPQPPQTSAPLPDDTQPPPAEPAETPAAAAEEPQQ